MAFLAYCMQAFFLRSTFLALIFEKKKKTLFFAVEVRTLEFLWNCSLDFYFKLFFATIGFKCAAKMQINWIELHFKWSIKIHKKCEMKLKCTILIKIAKNGSKPFKCLKCSIWNESDTINSHSHSHFGILHEQRCFRS